ncbi:MAG TPA: alkaline phosphatase [Planctomycetaceae bacterium]|nr:alkaline phosphatase [Planctomycetaceae bacterium]
MTDSRMTVSRRRAIGSFALAASSFGFARSSSNASEPHVSRLSRIQLGLVADVHQDIIHDGYARITSFISDMVQRKPDAILQLGDFALPRRRNQPFLDVWNSFDGDRYHVLGNHDMRDLGFKREQTMEWWGMKSRYYSFDVGGWHFVVLDGNDPNPGRWSGYVRYIGEEQREWLEADLRQTSAPTIVFSHQQLESDSGIANSGEVREILENANQEAARTKVIACFCGHHHTDKLTEIAGIRYIHINSMSYKWVGGNNARLRFPKHIEETYSNVKKTVPYQDPLYTVLTLDPDSMTMGLEGRSTSFVPPSPSEMRLPNAEQMKSQISSRTLRVSLG